MRPRSIFLVPDQGLGWVSLRAELRAMPEVEIAGEAETSVDVCRYLLLNQPDILITSSVVDASSNRDLLIEVRQNLSPDSRIVVVTHRLDSTDIHDMVDVGIDSCLAWADLDSLVLPCYLTAIAHGATLFSPSCTMALNEHRVDGSSIRSSNTSFTARERQIMNHLYRGLSRAEIAALLDISERTVKRDIACLRDKMHVEHEFALGVKAVLAGVVA